MADNPFLKLYKTIDSSELFDIIDFPNDFQPLAVEAARLELESRQLTPEQLEGAKTRQDLRPKKKMHEKQAMQNIEDKMTSLIDTFSPIQKGRLVGRNFSDYTKDRAHNDPFDLHGSRRKNLTPLKRLLQSPSHSHGFIFAIPTAVALN